MLTFGLLKTSVGELAFGSEKNTPRNIAAKISENITVIPVKNIFCLCLGDINTTAIFTTNYHEYLTNFRESLIYLFVICEYSSSIRGNSCFSNMNAFLFVN